MRVVHGRAGVRKGGTWTQLLKGSRIEDEDDDLSIASTLSGDDQSETASLQSLRSANRTNALAAVPLPSTRSLEGFAEKREQGQGHKRSVRFENIKKVSVIGKGSSGLVWRCVDKSNSDELALKEVLLDDDEEKTKLAVRELVTMYSVDHAGVVTCHEVFYSRGAFQMVLEYMDGGSLLDAMRRARDSCRGDGVLRGDVLGPSALAVVGRSVAGALEMLHDVLEVVHRDVKPGNILLTCAGQVKLADLGICTHPGTVQSQADGAAECETPATEWIGTVTYMSPERLVGDPYSFKADMWSLGIVLAEAALGRYPFAPTAAGPALEFWDLLDCVLTGPCPSLAMARLGPEWQGLAAVAASCLDKDPAQRPRARDLKMVEALGAGDCEELAGWVCRHMPELGAGKHTDSEPAVLKQEDMWS